MGAALRPPLASARHAGLLHCANPVPMMRFFAAVAAIGVLSGASLQTQQKPLHKFLPIEDKSNVSLAYIWLDIAEEVTAREVEANGPRPTIGSRTLAIWATAMYDAWAAYDEKAVGSRLGGKLRRPA